MTGVAQQVARRPYAHSSESVTASGTSLQSLLWNRATRCRLGTVSRASLVVRFEERIAAGLGDLLLPGLLLSEFVPGHATR